MSHVGSGGGHSFRTSWHLAVFYVLLLIAVIVLGTYLYGYLTTPLVRFQDYGYSLDCAVQPLKYSEAIQIEPKGKSATINIALPSNVALEEAQACIVVAMHDVYTRRPDLDVIVVYAYYEFSFAKGSYFSLGHAVWGSEGRAAPVVHHRRKDSYQIAFHWKTNLPTIDARRLKEAQQEKQQSG
jgi:hypothetical protein